jgi:hypothetical protein
LNESIASFRAVVVTNWCCPNFIRLVNNVRSGIQIRRRDERRSTLHRRHHRRRRRTHSFILRFMRFSLLLLLLDYYYYYYYTCCCRTASCDRRALATERIIMQSTVTKEGK